MTSLTLHRPIVEARGLAARLAGGLAEALSVWPRALEANRLANRWLTMDDNALAAHGLNREAVTAQILQVLRGSDD